MLTPLKRWFNKRWPYHRICMGPWHCLRGQTYQYRCHKHQYWNDEPYFEGGFIKGLDD